MISALAALLMLQTAEPAVWRQTEVPVAELLGRSPSEVALRLGAAPDPNAADALRVAAEGRSLEVYPLQRFWRQPGEGEGCATGFVDLPAEPGDATPGRRLARRSSGVLIFEAGRLVSVHPNPLRPGIDGPVTQQGARALVYGPHPPSPFAAAPGRLPLADGLAVLQRLEPAPEGLSIGSACRDRPETGTRSGDVGTDLIWGMIGLVVLPTAPFARAVEDRAEREGVPLLASIGPGEVLPGGPEGFAAGRRGVRVYRDAEDPGFALIAIRLGPGEDNAADVGLIGVRGDQVVWKVERAAADRLGLRGLVCRDAENRASRRRPGCSGTGFLVP
ncbi:MAG: hypothetical protein A2623_01445 [Caulobacterales bacterium RIFCSPHIGHO2_01_FULL_70_19]|nr:MAG: hypothetical protein A2623_01445 [Caulobacterales bacterium RIFCSPHIGHO2_01_FULL_70_19]